MLRARARLYQGIRSYFETQNVLEVETPILGRSTATDLHLDSLLVPDTPDGVASRYLHTSPEFPMKRLLASGYPSIYQICKVFRRGESGKKHNPEFSMLEWYRVSYSLDDLIEDVARLLDHLGLQLSSPHKVTYRDVFLKYLDIDPFTANRDILESHCSQLGLERLHQFSRDDLLDCLMSHFIEPKLGIQESIFIIEYPASQASLANTHVDGFGAEVASRFELYLGGMEIANGYHELLDSELLRERFERDNAQRRVLGKEVIPLDDNLLKAIGNGMPECSGVALGLDRLLMFEQGVTDITDVIAFPNDRC